MVFTRNRNGARRFVALLVVLSLAAALLALTASPSLAASSYRWDGGHDVFGSSVPTRAAYFAEGTTRNGFEEYLLLRNPGATAASVTVTYNFPAPATPLAQHLSLSAGAGASIRVNDVVGPEKDVSVALSANRGIIAERQLYFNYRAIWTGGSDSCGVAAPARRWYFAEGTTRAGFKEWLCLQNPSGSAVDADLTFMLQSGETVARRVNLGAHSRATLAVDAIVGTEKDVSVQVDALTPIVAERPMYFDYHGAMRGGHTVAGSPALSTQWYFAEGTTRGGFEEWLCLMNPGADAVAHVEYLIQGGGNIARDYRLAGHARTTIPVNSEAGPEKDVSIRVTCPTGILAERPMYFKYHGAWEGGHVVPGTSTGATSWTFPTAAAEGGFESWLCLMNPGDLANPVSVQLLGDGGAVKNLSYNLAPRTRFTLNLTDAAQGMTNSWLKVTGQQNIIAERPTYFAYQPMVEPQPFTIATWSGIDIKSPIRYCDLLGPTFHEAYATGGDGQPDNAQAMQPVGVLMRDDNPGRRHPDLRFDPNGDAGYFIQETRGRGTHSTTACDVQAKAGTTVYAPVNGVVLEAAPYMLYGQYPDLRVRILIDGKPGFHVEVLHMDSIAVSRGQRVEAGKTPVGTVRNLVPYFNSGPNPYTRDDGNHTHIQINYRPDMHL